MKDYKWKVSWNEAGVIREETFEKDEVSLHSGFVKLNFGNRSGIGNSTGFLPLDLLEYITKIYVLQQNEEKGDKNESNKE